ncbi:MAG: LysM peptidoglycan-binding domain-containing protein [Bacteroidota bacterium]
MRYQKLNNQLTRLIRIVVLTVVPFASYTQTDTVSTRFIQKSEANLVALNELYCWNDSTFYNGKVLFKEETEFLQAFSNINLQLFPEIQPGAGYFYNYINQLDIESKQNLVWCFNYYESYYNKKFKTAGLPTDIKYFAPAISAMNLNAVGENREAGIWQLTHFQGVLNGLQINRLVDERFNVYASTQATIRQLKQNIEFFKDTELAILGYLAGNANLRNTINRAGENTSVDKILELLPERISEQIAAFQAMAVFLKVNRFKHDAFEVNPDTVVINRQLHFIQISNVLSIPEEQLRFLNPQFRFSIVPGDVASVNLLLPSGKRDDFIIWQDSIYNVQDSSLFQVIAQKIEYPPAPGRQYIGEKVKDLEIEGKTKIKYTLKTGDVLGFIAEDYDVRVADLKYWNNIYNERRIQAGQKLDIFVDDDKAEYYLSLQKQTISKGSTADVSKQKSQTLSETDLKSAKKVEHIVKSGESPYVIAKKYVGVTPEEILEWNGINDPRKIQIGQKLIVYLK